MTLIFFQNVQNLMQFPKIQQKIGKIFLLSWIIAFELLHIKSPNYCENTRSLGSQRVNIIQCLSTFPSGNLVVKWLYKKCVRIEHDAIATSKFPLLLREYSQSAVNMLISFDASPCFLLAILQLYGSIRNTFTQNMTQCCLI